MRPVTKETGLHKYLTQHRNDFVDMVCVWQGLHTTLLDQGFVQLSHCLSDL